VSNNILVTGGAGYIGSHTLIELIDAGFSPVVLDNFCNSKPEALKRVETITGSKIPLIEGDVRDPAVLDSIFSQYKFKAVIHFAGLKAVGESVSLPGMYYDVNVNGSNQLFMAMQRANVHRLIFSSSATVYGDPASVPIDESFPLSATNPYGRSKLMVEEICRDLANADLDKTKGFQFALLRYFNPVGSHESGLIGEDPNGIPNNLMPFISQVAAKKLAQLNIFGDDYDTPDGTGVRDYIHVVDLAKGHVAALNWLLNQESSHSFCEPFNLGTGEGYSVLQMLKSFSSINGIDVPFNFAPRRPGDVAECYASTEHARSILKWEATKTLNDMMKDTWRWQKNNPNGYT